MRLSLIILLALALVAQNAEARQDSTVFEGRPLKRVEVGFEGMFESPLNSEQAFEFQVRIVERNGRYFWASRGMK